MASIPRRASVLLALPVVAGCTAAIGSDPPVVIHVPPGPVVVGDGGGRADGFNIPPGHLPPPGSCRVWYPDRPPGQQPPPGSCNAYVPVGAVLVYGR
jgi:hypothetical protein